MGVLEGMAISALMKWGIGIVGGFILTALLNLIPKDKIEKAFFGFGVFVTAGLSKWPLTKGVWNKTIEPFFINLLESMLSGFVRGLRSDNER